MRSCWLVLFLFLPQIAFADMAPLPGKKKLPLAFHVTSSLGTQVAFVQAIFDRSQGYRLQIEPLPLKKRFRPTYGTTGTITTRFLAFSPKEAITLLKLVRKEKTSLASLSQLQKVKDPLQWLRGWKYNSGVKQKPSPLFLFFNAMDRVRSDKISNVLLVKLLGNMKEAVHEVRITRIQGTRLKIQLLGRRYTVVTGWSSTSDANTKEAVQAQKRRRQWAMGQRVLKALRTKEHGLYKELDDVLFGKVSTHEKQEKPENGWLVLLGGCLIVSVVALGFVLRKG